MATIVNKFQNTLFIFGSPPGRARTSANARKAMEVLLSEFALESPTAGPLTLDDSSLSIWTQRFSALAEEAQVFSAMASSLQRRFDHAEIVADAWLDFSEFMPFFLCQAATKMRDNRRRHFIVRVAFEELGERNPNEIHADLFLMAAKSVGVLQARPSTNSLSSVLPYALQFLQKQIETAETDSEILGLGLGLEIVAYQNIDTLFAALAYDPGLERKLRQTEFFRLHFINEEEHIRLTVSNFLLFCKTHEERNQFQKGFRQALRFWTIFWSRVAEDLRSA